MKFYCDVFPNLQVSIWDTTIQFKDGVYETEDPKIVDTLIAMDFRADIDEGDIIADTDTNDIIKYEIPKRWTKTKILDYAKEKGIYTADMEELTKQELTDFIESM